MDSRGIGSRDFRLCLKMEERGSGLAHGESADQLKRMIRFFPAGLQLRGDHGQNGMRT